jgi:hypothetical protein
MVEKRGAAPRVVLKRGAEERVAEPRTPEDLGLENLGDEKRTCANSAPPEMEP